MGKKSKSIVMKKISGNSFQCICTEERGKGVVMDGSGDGWCECRGEVEEREEGVVMGWCECRGGWKREGGGSGDGMV